MIWEPEVIERAKSMWAAGNSASVIAAALGITRNAVLGKVRRLRWPSRPTIAALGHLRPPRRSAPWTSDVTEAAKRMWSIGDSANIIAKALGLTRNAVLGKVRREEWPRSISAEARERIEGRLARLKARHGARELNPIDRGR